MKGHGYKSVVAENLLALNPSLGLQQAMSRKKKMCWRCQKEKPVADGYLKIMPGLMKFVCAECLKAKAAATEQP